MDARLTDREKRWAREERAFWRLMASGRFGGRLDDGDFRQRMYRLAEERATLFHRRLVRNENAQRRARDARGA